MAKPASDDRGVYVDPDRLISLERKGRRVSLLPRQPVSSLLSGRYSSRLRGRGLNFEEIRDYRSGDDVRSIDWKVTARLGKPHIRVFKEERDRQAAVDGGDGSASVKLSRADAAIAKKVAARTMSDPSSDPITGAELGQGAQPS